MSTQSAFVNWTNKSVLGFAKGRDPLMAISERAAELALRAFESGWSGPPYDPFRLAELLKLQVIPRDDISDARIIEGPSGHALIEFNPRRPSARIRFSLAHEIAHTLFPDCLERARFRARRSAYMKDDWQLEMLCNIGAAEILMPVGSFGKLRSEQIEINHLMALRRSLEVSTEALLLRVVKLARLPVGCFAASFRSGFIRIDYSSFSSSWEGLSSRKIVVPDDSVIQKCDAIGLTGKAFEVWEFDGKKTDVDVQVIGLPPYPGATTLRVAGIVRPKLAKAKTEASINYLYGDALKPEGKGKKLIAQIVNDATPRWGGRGFASAIKNTWPDVQNDFNDWAKLHKQKFKLGAVRFFEHSPDIVIASMVAQHGYGPSERPRIRYTSLGSCLQQLGKYASDTGCTLHLPKIGTGYGGGDWDVIEELLEDNVCSKGIKVFAYQLPR